MSPPVRPSVCRRSHNQPQPVSLRATPAARIKQELATRRVWATNLSTVDSDLQACSYRAYDTIRKKGLVRYFTRITFLLITVTVRVRV